MNGIALSLCSAAGVKKGQHNLSRVYTRLTKNDMNRHQAGFGASYKWRAPEEHRGRGLAGEISGHLKIAPGEVSALIDFGSVYVRGRIERNPAREITGGEEITVNFPAHGIRKFYEIDPSRIIFRDRFLLAYDKEPGIPS